MTGVTPSGPGSRPSDGAASVSTLRASIPNACSMGVGCDEAGVCYAVANGQPERCPKASQGAEATIAYIAKVSEAIAWQAGVGGMETAGSIVSYLAEHPEHIGEFMAGGSVLDWPVGWHEQGRLSWHGMNGKIVSPEYARRARQIRKMEKGA